MGNRIIRAVKSIIPNRLKLKYKEAFEYKARAKIIANQISRTKDHAIFLIGSPEHSNLGDHAISIAEKQFINEKTNLTCVEVTRIHFVKHGKDIKKLVRKNDIIAITGGGFIGTLWLNEETMVRKVIESFPNNKIIIFPQTVFYETGEPEQIEYEKSKAIFNAHDNLHIFLREQTSYDFCVQSLFVNNSRTNIYLAPDMVMYLNNHETYTGRNNLTLCLRNDKERVLSEGDRNAIEDFAKESGLNVKSIDTVIGSRQRIETRKIALEEKLNEFRNSKLVITDRLHGMLFSYITNTPCIALNNSSGKVKGVYDTWLKEVSYICCVDDLTLLSKKKKQLISLESAACSPINIEEAFIELRDVLLCK